MEQVTRRTVLALPMPAALLTLAGCKSTTATSVGDMNPADLDFVTNGYNLIQFDIQESELAQTYAKSQAVKDIATRLLADAHLAQEKFDPVIKAAGITLPSELRSDLRIRLFHIRRDSGLDFDRSFVDDQIASHVEFQDRYNMMEDTPGQNSQLVALAAQARPYLVKNLADLRAIQKQLPPSPATTPPFRLPPLSHHE
jgi:predicted outer membrane protein